jgi:1-deoxy-D-xylulose-5-phosphate synthase
MFHDALEITSGPVAIRWPKTAARQSDDVGHGLRGRKVREGADLCIIAVGKMLEAAELAAETLASEGVSTTVWDARVVKPLDDEMILDATRHPFVLTIEDGLREGGVGSAIADRVAEQCGSSAPRVRVLGTPTAYIPHGKPDAILADLGLDAVGLADAARALLAQR